MFVISLNSTYFFTRITLQIIESKLYEKKKIKVFLMVVTKSVRKRLVFTIIWQKNKFNWIDLNSKNKVLKSIGISKGELLRSLHIQLHDGRIIKGVNAFRIIWREYPYLKFFSYMLDYKIIRIIARPVYRLLVKIKSFIT